MAIATLGLGLKLGIVTSVVLPFAIVRAIFKSIPGLFGFAWLNTVDLAYFLGNVFLPALKQGSVVKPGLPGHKGIWPPFVPAGEDDSRSPCPYLNALANHGILPHDGKNIVLKDLGRIMGESFNFSSTLCENTAGSVEGLYGRPTIELSDLAAHNVIEHDASMVRHDAFFQPDQTRPSKDLINALLLSASGPASPAHPQGYLTPGDIARYMEVREADSRKRNPVFKLDGFSRFFGESNATLMYEAVAGDVATLRTILLEERFPDGYESSMRQRFGLTMKEFHTRSLQIFLTQKLGISL